ncbi:MAG: RnfH family protein [Aquincola tertiaricarbonis]|uniref:RnfH family protein n=1 Tax=Aquincola TaxID=391952 RepID=UPI000614A6C7|nr:MULTISPECIES: RnfH family protein [Aquincola]MCR5864629.1 RnfH family protein [Aquincola sp. J276]
MASADDAAPLRIEVVYSPAADQTDRVMLRLPAGSTLREAVLQSGLPARHGLRLEALKHGIWGRLAPPDQPLRDRDRIELYRPLQVDPKEARRLRYKGQRRG